MSSAELNLTPFPEVSWVLHDLLGHVSDILDKHFIGMYLYGSLAIGDFHPSRSDIDFAVITDHHLPDRVIRELELMHLALATGSRWQRKLEGAYVPKAVIRRHDPQNPPLPTVNEGNFYMAPLGSDWVMQRKILRETECAVYGTSLRTLIDPVSSEDLRAAILEAIDTW